EQRIMLTGTSPSIIQVQVASNYSDESQIATLTSSITKESLLGSDDSCDCVPSSPADFSVPDTPFGADERSLNEKDDNAFQSNIAIKGSRKSKEPSPDIIILETVWLHLASSPVPLTPSQHAARYRQRMARKVSYRVCKIAGIHNRIPESQLKFDAISYSKLIASSSNDGEATGSSGSAGLSGSLPSNNQSKPGTSSGANQDEGPALGPMLMLSYLKSCKGKEKSILQPGGTNSNVEKKRK
ncbi:hypothetical protein PENTCL1PPCAC_13093, partial [Pristionchus entomophagus]